MIAHRLNLIKLADASAIGWRVVNEYVSNPLASDSDDEEKIYKAEARASRKLKADKTKKRRPRTMPYGRPTVKAIPEETTNMMTSPPNRRPLVCALPVESQVIGEVLQNAQLVLLIIK